MKRKVLMFLMVFLVLFSGLAFANQDKTSKGFYWPIGEDDQNFNQKCGTWLGRNSDYGKPNCYNFETDKGEKLYHIGVDMMTYAQTGEQAEAYAIADGIVADVYHTGWGTGNCGVFILHYTKEGVKFTSVTGHLWSKDQIINGEVVKVGVKVKAGQFVKAGQLLGYTGPWDSNSEHVHFGIYPGEDYPKRNWGRMPNSKWTNPCEGNNTCTNGFTDPIKFLKENTPAPIVDAQLVAETVIVPNGSNDAGNNCKLAEGAYKIIGGNNLATVNLVQSCEEVELINASMQKAVQKTGNSAMIEEESSKSIYQKMTNDPKGRLVAKFFKAFIRWKIFNEIPTFKSNSSVSTSRSNSVDVKSTGLTQKSSSNGIFYLPIKVVFTEKGGYILDEMDPTIQGYNLYSADEEPEPDKLLDKITVPILYFLKKRNKETRIED